MRAILTILALALASCGGGNTPSPSPSGGWTFAYSNNVSGSCDAFNFPNQDGVHYYVKPMVVKAGQTITMSLSLSGNGSLVPSSDSPPATMHLFLQRKGDDLSCVGALQQYRYWSTAVVRLNVPGSYTLTSPVSPDKWTDCYGKSGADHPAEFQGAVNNLSTIGYTFGGANFSGHGVYANGSVRFQLISYSVQ